MTNTYNRDDLPTLSETDRVQLTTNTDSFEATVQERTENTDSTAYTLSIDGETVKMYADIRAVKLIIDNETQFVRSVETE